MMMTKKPSNSRALWKYLAVLPLCFLLVFAFANRDGKTDFSILSFSQNNFDTTVIESEIQKLFDAVNEVSPKEKEVAFNKLASHFSQLILEYPKHREEIMDISDKVANEVGIPVAIANFEAKDGTLPVLVHLCNFTDPVYKKVDEMPRFPGCEEKAVEEREECSQHEMLMFIYNNIKYPQEARDKNIQGTVVTRFVIGADGEIRDAKIVREVGGGCDEAVLEIVAQMPDWIPGKKDGKSVAVEFHLPVKFKLADDAPKEEIKEEKRPDECFVKGLELQDLSIAPNPSTGTFRLKFSAEKKPLIIVVSDMDENLLYTKEIKNFSGLFDEEITVETKATIANVIIMQGKLLHTSRITIVK